MDALTIRNYHNDVIPVYNREWKEQKTDSERLIFTPELQRKLAEAEKRRSEGKCVSCRTKEELQAFLDSL